MTKRLLTVGILLITCLQLSGCFALLASGAAAGAMMAHDRRSTGAIVEDQSIELKAYRIISELDDENQAHISAISYNNNLVLLGQTSSATLRQAVEEQVARLNRVQRVYNEIQVSAPTSLMTRSSDSWITTKIKGEMLLTKALDPTRIKVITEDGVVYLLGIITQTEETAAVDIARHTKGVKRVVKMFEYLPETTPLNSAGVNHDDPTEKALLSSPEA